MRYANIGKPEEIIEVPIKTPAPVREPVREPVPV